jgi:hypothetical protein
MKDARKLVEPEVELFEAQARLAEAEGRERNDRTGYESQLRLPAEENA